MAMMLYSIPRRPTDTIATVRGLGEIWRVRTAIEEWKESRTARYLLIANSSIKEKTHEPLSSEVLRKHPFSLRKLQGVHWQVESGDNTKVQAEWMAERVMTLGLRSITLFVPAYHLLRAYCTILKTFIKHDLCIPLIPAVVQVPLELETPETGVGQWDMATGEVERMVTYQKLGDVATAPELRAYLGWLATQPR